jgi:predicted permease
MRGWWSRLWVTLIGRRDMEEDLREEVEFHLEQEIEENLSRGMSPKQAREAARRRFGNSTLIREGAMEAWTFRPIENVVRDVRYAFRGIQRNPAHAAIVALTLALGIAGTTGVFSLIQGILLKPLPYRDSERLVVIRESIPVFRERGMPEVRASAEHFRAWRRQSASFENLSLAFQVPFPSILGALGSPRQATVIQVLPNFLRTLGAAPQKGRDFSEGEDTPGSDQVVIVTDSFWRNQFGENTEVGGQTILLDGRPHEIVGVLPPGFQFPEFYRNDGIMAELFTPLELKVLKPHVIDWGKAGGNFNYWALGRLRSGISAVRAQADLNSIQAAFGAEAVVRPLLESVVAQRRTGLWLALAAVGAILLVACVNIANLTLARGAAQNHQLAVRSALGAGTAALRRQLLVESLCLAGLGGGLGVAAAYWGVTFFVRRALVDLPRLAEVTVDGAVLAFAVLCTVASGILFGLVPTFRFSRMNAQSVLSGAGRGNTETTATGRLRGALIGSEVALTALLLIGAGLLLHSLIQVMSRERGFDANHVATAKIQFPAANRQAQLLSMQAILRAVEQLPGVRSAGLINRLPVSGEEQAIPVLPQAPAGPPPAGAPWPNFRVASPGYFEALGIPLQAGRVFEEGDDGESVAVISESLGRRLWPGENPVGHEMWWGGGRNNMLRVVGVVADVLVASLEADATMVVYRPYWFEPRPMMTLVLRTEMDPASSVGAIRRIVREVAPEVPEPQFRTMRQVVSGSVSGRNFSTLLVSAFGGIALLLACLGVYGVVSYSVARRRNEIGIRLALGARPGQVRGLVLRQGMLPVIFGVVAGLLGAAAVARTLESMLYQVESLDPATFLAVPAVLLLVALAACYFPARRAARVDPMIALRRD